MSPLAPRQVRFRYLAVLALRWLPTGLLIPVTTLLMLERGLGLAEVGLVVAGQGIVVLFLELPTGGVADTLGRRPVLILASVLALLATGLMAVASSASAFLVVWLVWGASRALDSGPLDAWFVDATLAADPQARLEPGLGAFETLTPVRLAETTGSAETAAALLGPVTAAAWLVSAAGAAVAPALAARFGAAPTAAVFRIAQGATVVAMGSVAGTAGVVTGFLACYAVHGASNPVHQALLHRQVDGAHRTSVLSLNSMAAQPAGSLGSIVLAAVAGATSTGLAMVIAGFVLAAAAPLYLPAWRAAGTGSLSADPGSAG